MQSDATAGTLIQNALNAGYVESEIEEKEVAQAEWQAILDAQPKPEPQLSEQDKRLVTAEEDILTAMEAITEVYEQLLMGVV